MQSRMDVSGRELTSKAHGECSACSNEIFPLFFSLPFCLLLTQA